MRSVRWNAGKGRHRSRGQSLVEFAIVFPIFILLLAAIIDFGLGLYSYMTVINAAREGARLGATVCALHGCEGDVIAKVRSAASQGGLSLGDGSVTVTCERETADLSHPEAFNCATNRVPPDDPSVYNVKVAVSYTYAFIFRMPWPMDKMTSLNIDYRMSVMVE